ncbi:MAG: NlpC/P60 family protein [Bacteroides sp.]|nr:NlpC/P60 family protein [Eubacterium sp.]MCM1418688.1 NlpC/P60 family protein [Roseburia sp.]MCM1462716.1 NlpC/P60 family protein [Bacteroides sp.]
MKRTGAIILTLLLLLCGCAAEVETTTPAPTPTEPTGSTEPTETTTRETSGFATTAPLTSSETTEYLAEPPETEKPPETALIPEDYDNAIVKTAEGLIGIAFADGGTTPADGFDNSGFIYYVLRTAGYVGCPRQIGAQIEWGETADYAELKPGDVAYFSSEAGGAAEFGGIYAGGGIMIYSPYPGETVKKTDITTNYWSARFVTALSL